MTATVMLHLNELKVCVRTSYLVSFSPSISAPAVSAPVRQAAPNLNLRYHQATIIMRVISNKALLDFARTHIGAQTSLQTWRRAVELREFANFSELKATFNSVDRVGQYFVFNVGGNKYRIVTAVHFDRRILYVRHVFTHREYDSWTA